MSIFSRRKRTRHLASLAISAVATSLCSSQVALCLPFVVRIEGISFDGNNVYILGYDVNAREQKFEMEIKVGKYEVYLASDKAKFEKKINRNTRYSDSFRYTIDFSDRFAEIDLNVLKREFEEEELSIRQREQNECNVNRICYLIGEYEWDSRYADEYSIEINANGDSGLKENLRKIILRDPLIQHGLRYPKCYSDVKMINGELRKITITKQEDKYCIEVKPRWEN